MKRKMRIVPTLSFVIGSFVFITAVSILFIEFRSSQKLLRTLGSELITEAMSGLNLFFDTRGHDVEEQARFIAASLQTGGLLLENQQEIASFLYASLAGTTQTSDVWVLSADGRATGVIRGSGDGVFTPLFSNVDQLPAFRSLFEEAEKSQDPFWWEPVYFADRAETFFIHAHPVYVNDTFTALVVAGVSVRQVSEIAEELSDQGFVVFMTAEDLLIAHPDIHEALGELSPTKPFLSLDEAPDPFLANYKSFERLEAKDHGLEDRYEVYIGETDSGDSRIMVLRNQTDEDFSNISVGLHFDAEAFNRPYLELINTLLLGISILAIALISATLLARWIARPVRRAAAGARQVAAFELEAVQTLPASNIRELNDLASGFNSMVGVLNAFVRYVPRSLVRRIISEGSDVSAPAERQLAVLFTDIAGFTSISEKMSAVETAEFINQHLTIVGGAIEQNGGTIDKYIGDSVMAFWGAPEQSQHPEQQALAAARAITLAIRADNKARAEKGLPPVRIRIGIHVGPLVVGDIGAPGRVNYTVIGDTVNIASRLESMGRDVDQDADVIILASRDVVSVLDMTDTSIESIGNRTVKGKLEPVEVVRIAV